jgi:hypothetical protein
VLPASVAGDADRLARFQREQDRIVFIFNFPEYLSTLMSANK